MELLFTEHLRDVRAFVRLQLDRSFRARESESDVVQSVCRNIIEKLPELQYRGRESFRSWLFKVTLNRVRQKWGFHHAQKRDLGRELTEHAHSSAELYSGICDVGASPSEVASLHEEAERIERAMDRLPPDYREVILLSRLVGMNHEQIAEEMQRSSGAVRTLLSRASVRLLAELEERGSV